MKRFWTFSLLLAMCVGCDRTNDAGDADNSQAQSTADGSSDDNGSGGTRSIPAYEGATASEVEYYLSRPREGRLPDGKLPAGTRFSIITELESEGYTLVRTEQGVQVYLATEAVQSAKPEGAAAMTEIVEGGNRFALDLYQQLRDAEGNLFFSPSSISIALAMAYAGAAGETAAQMAETLHLEMPSDQLHAGMDQLRGRWTTEDRQGIQLNLANRLWAQQSYEFLHRFQEVTRSQYGAEMAKLDFAETEAARRTINGWVEDETQGKISDLIPAGVLSEDTKLVLTNAIYFFGKWAIPFPEVRTRDADFHVTASNSVSVPTMNLSDSLRYAEIDELKILELPYGDGSFAMIILLPTANQGLNELEAKLSSESLQRWLDSLKREEEVRVWLPKFEATSEFQMADTLRGMGMQAAFDAGAADFTAMTGGRDLYLSAVIHKAFVEVNEAGTEAAAATGVVMRPTSVPAEPEKPLEFRADHPFVFLIRDQDNQAILFLGRVVNPLE